MAIFARYEIFSTNVDDFFLNLTIRKTFKLVPQRRYNPLRENVRTISRQFEKNVTLLLLTAMVSLLISTLSVSLFPSLRSPCLPCSIPQAFRSSRYRRWLRFTRSPYPRCFHLHPSDRSLCSPAVDEEKSHRSLRARRRENTSALYIFLDRLGHNSGDESVLLGPHRTHTLANPPSYLRSRFSFPTHPSVVGSFAASTSSEPSG